VIPARLDALQPQARRATDPPARNPIRRGDKVRRISYTLPLVVALSISACGGEGNGGGSGGSGTTDTRVIKAAPSFATDIQEIFTRRGCATSNCHGTAVSAGLDLRSGSSYANLVDVDATQENFVRVVPRNSAQSYLVIKLEGNQAVGVRMPVGGAALDSIDLSNIKNWINSGAENN
jgi:hypothetical protein